MGRIGSVVQVKVCFQKPARLVDRLGSGPCFVDRIGSGPRLVGRIGSVVQVRVSFQKTARQVGRLGRKVVNHVFVWSKRMQF